MVQDGADPVDVLARWEASGAAWRVLRAGEAVEVALLTCTGGEQVGTVVSADPRLREWLAEHESP
jgi:hypothetical protein